MKKSKFIAIDEAKITSCGMSDMEWKELSKTARPLLKGWWMVASKKIPSSVKKNLYDKKGIQSVFSSSETLIVTYPEIQVEEDRKQNADSFLQWIKENSSKINVLEESYGKWLIEPASGDGEEAMKMAVPGTRWTSLPVSSDGASMFSRPRP
jgi:hypothetical protein